MPTLAPRALGPQVADTEFAPRVSAPAYAGGGPKVFLDEAHHNFHTTAGRYATFVDVLRKDGFDVSPLSQEFTADSLAGADILVIANALGVRNTGGKAALPTYSAFTDDEIDALVHWVHEGGALLLIADHMPWAGAAADLARRFDVIMTNSFATDASCADDEFLFRRDDGSLADHAITRGRNAAESIEYVRSFTGQAFRLLGRGTPLMTVPAGTVLLLPGEPWRFSEATSQVPGDGMFQGAVLTHGGGRVAVFGEAAMFSAQVSGAERRPMGMNMPSAAQNPQFLLNVMHWLSGLLSGH